MLVRFDYRCEDNFYCPSKGYRVERLVNKGKQDEQHCKTCHKILHRLPATPHTLFRFNDTHLKP